MNLYDLGWMGAFLKHEVDESSLAKITGVHLNYFKAISKDGELNCYLSGKHHYEEGFKLTVGDWCLVHKNFVDEKNCNAAMIEKLIPRKSKISRMKVGGKEQIMAANVDYCFIVTSANNDFNINRLDRYLQLAKAGNVKPVIVLSKIDVCDNYESIYKELLDKFSGVDIFAISVVNNIGLDKIDLYTKEAGMTGVCLGSSGVGKSTLINYILGDSVQETREVREQDSKGKHTTTARELFFISTGGMIIDTPGIREVQLLTGDIEIKEKFNELSVLEQSCKFSDCGHDTEPGCAVKSALKEGSITDEELKSYFKLKSELERNEKKFDQDYKAEQSQKNKKLSKYIRDKNKFNK